MLVDAGCDVRAHHTERIANYRERRLLLKLAVRSYKAANPWPGNYIPGFERERQAQDAFLGELRRTPALLISMAVLSHADDATRAKVAGVAELATLARPECEASRHAFLLAQRIAGDLPPEARILNTAFLARIIHR